MITRRTFLGNVAAATAGAALARPAIAQSSSAQTLRFVPQANLTSLDPIWTTATVTTNHAYYVFDTLYALDGRQQPQPQMAQGHEVSADGRVWRIGLREGLKFHDGSPVRGVDCIASLKRWAEVDVLGQLLAALVEDWSAPDDRTLEIKLKRSFPMLLAGLAKADAVGPFIMPERLARTPARTQVTEMIGSGPYRFVAAEFVPGSRAVYTRFDDYVPRQQPPDWASGGKVANFDRVEWVVIPDTSTAAAALQAGEVDWWERPSSDLVPMLAKDRRIVVRPQNQLGQMAVMRLNCLQAPFDQLELRRAVMMSINQEDYMTAVFGAGKDAWSSCYGVFPRGTPYYSEEGAELLKGPHEPAAVHRALQDAGYSGQKVVILNPTDFPTIGPLGDVAYDALRRAGMNVELAASDWGTVIQRRVSREPVEKGGWSIFTTWGPGLATGNPIFSPWARGQGATGWFGWFEDAKTEALVQDWLYAADDEKRRQLASTINARVLGGVGTIPLGQGPILTAFRADLTGMVEANNPLPWNLRRI
ncbi:MAG: ABC transporter substrate-binding protein [Hyphomicrobiales bacterium]